MTAWASSGVRALAVEPSGSVIAVGGGGGGPGAAGGAPSPGVPAGTGDAGWLRAFDAVVPPVLRAFAPQVLVTQHGCDTHELDPLADALDRVLTLTGGQLTDDRAMEVWRA